MLTCSSGVKQACVRRAVESGQGHPMADSVFIFTKGIILCCSLNHCNHFVPQIIAFDELKTDYKNPIDQCNTLNPVSDTVAPNTLFLPLWLHADMLCWKGFSIYFQDECIFFQSFLCTVLLNNLPVMTLVILSAVKLSNTFCFCFP